MRNTNDRTFRYTLIISFRYSSLYLVLMYPMRRKKKYWYHAKELLIKKLKKSYWEKKMRNQRYISYFLKLTILKLTIVTAFVPANKNIAAGISSLLFYLSSSPLLFLSLALKETLFYVLRHRSYILLSKITRGSKFKSLTCFRTK